MNGPRSFGHRPYTTTRHTRPVLDPRPPTTDPDPPGFGAGLDVSAPGFTPADFGAPDLGASGSGSAGPGAAGGGAAPAGGVAAGPRAGRWLVRCEDDPSGPPR